MAAQPFKWKTRAERAAAAAERTAEQRAIRKFLTRMLPVLVLMLVINQMDRTNVGFVQDDLRADVGVSATAYGLGAGLFFIGYALFEVPSNMLLERLGARVWLTRIMITWGAVILGMCFIHDVWAFYGLRFLLGVAEAGFFPGVMLYFTQWLPNSHRGKASAIFLGGSATAYIVTGPITGALLEMHGIGGIAGWRWMFALEGGFSIVFGIFAGFFLVSRIRDARWLSDEEKEALSSAVESDRKERTRAPGTSGIKLLFQGQVAALTCVFFAMALTGYAITFWLPSLVEEIGGLSPFQVGLISAIPWIFAVIAMYTTNHFTDRLPDRRPYLAAALVLSALGTFLATLGSPWFGLVAITLAAVGGKVAAGVFWPMAQHGLDVKIAAPGLALVNSLGNLGGFVSPTLFGYLKDTTGSTNGGLYTLSAASLLALIGVALIRNHGRGPSDPVPANAPKDRLAAGDA
ncbi:MFS transporter [Streptomyces sp. NBC_00006]|uniref:MFS transporter n=1 Tax=unclassified Streptomyces TaxID=2593676 RepID=UPI00225399FB|nr:MULTISPECIES: MFS transporter [unclassified Streptomyces]MCX4835792.1 MFS transporter [Streptomyces sp. NBC_01016]MCX5537007.1 MFS transporter [Streptomyces sp. NBC_00006]